MTFEEALKAMREGEFVIFDGRSYPLCLIDNRVCELTHHGFEPLDSMNTCNICAVISGFSALKTINGFLSVFVIFR